MSVVQIPNLPSATSLSGSEQVEIVQAGVSVRTTTQAIADLAPIISDFRLAYRSVANPYTIALTDTVLDCNGTFTITLPTASGIAGKIYIIKNSGTGIISVTCFDSETIDGLVTRRSDVQYQSIMVISDGSNWKVI